MRRADAAGNAASDPRPAVIERRYNDFSFVYECILKNFHPSVLGDFLFPKKVLIGNFKAEVITERTEAFHKFLNQGWTDRLTIFVDLISQSMYWLYTRELHFQKGKLFENNSCKHRQPSKQISNCDNLLYSEYFYSFLSSEEHNEAVSHIKLSRYDEAHPLLEVNRYFPQFLGPILTFLFRTRQSSWCARSC